MYKKQIITFVQIVYIFYNVVGWAVKKGREGQNYIDRLQSESGVILSLLSGLSVSPDWAWRERQKDELASLMRHRGERHVPALNSDFSLWPMWLYKACIFYTVFTKMYVVVKINKLQKNIYCINFNFRRKKKLNVIIPSIPFVCPQKCVLSLDNTEPLQQRPIQLSNSWLHEQHHNQRIWRCI